MRETASPEMAPDPLSDLLRVVRLDGAFFYTSEATAEPWGVESLSARELTPAILPGAEHLIAYHVLIKGRCYGSLLDGEAVELAAGDVIVFPHGDAHLMASDRGVRLPSEREQECPGALPRHGADRRPGPQGNLARLRLPRL
jgi:hypothetical protein